MTFYKAAGLVLLLLDFWLVMTLIWWPLSRRGRSDDRGDGISSVVLPARPRSVNIVRTAAFVLVGSLLTVAYLGQRFPRPITVYTHAAGALANFAVQNPLALRPYVDRMTATAPAVFAAAMLALACTVRGSVVRRLVVALHGAVYVVASLIVDSMLLVVAIATGWPIAPYGLFGGLVHILLAFVVFVRVVFTTFMLPMPSRIPASRPLYWRDTLLWWSAMIGSIAALGVGWALLAQHYRFSSDATTVASFVLLGAWSPVMYCFLLVVRLFRRPLPGALVDPPPVNVIIAAYNEADRIALCLRGVDAAAGRYGGDVHVIVTNDGSTDATVAVTESCFVAFRHASGEIVHHSVNSGSIAKAYNTAFNAATRDIIIRVDGDTVVHPDAFRFSVPWLLASPLNGQVAGMSLPRPGQRTPFAVMRGFECLLGFGFARCAEEVVDTILNVQGPYACMRREVIEQVQGWTYGMNGEDLDMTMKVTRLGYRVVHDLRVVTYEDVPLTVGEFRGQRNRWSRAGTHNYARFSPFSAGNTGPRSWYQFTRLFSSRLISVIQPFALVLVLDLAIFDPTVRRTVLIFAVLYALRFVVAFFQFVLLAQRWGRMKYLLLFPLWYPYLVFRHVLTLEGLLSLPTRPVSLMNVAERRVVAVRASWWARRRWQPLPIAAAAGSGGPVGAAKRPRRWGPSPLRAPAPIRPRSSQDPTP